MSAAPVKKACDACHRRKVRCSGGQPCKNCGQASLQCTYLAIPQKKGPKGSRAKVISEIRDTQQQSVKASSSTKSTHELERNPFDFNTSPISPGYSRNSELLTQQTIESCIAFYFDHLYPTLPIFHRQKLTDLAANHRDCTIEAYCLIATLCAFMMIQPGMTLPGYQDSPDGSDTDPMMRHAVILLDEVRRMRKGLDIVESPTIYSVQTSFFLFASYFSLEKSNACWYHIREATTLAQLLLMHEESSYHSGDPIDNIFRRRTYWLLLLTERAYAMERHRPLTLHGTIELPTEEENRAEWQIISGFLALVNLYRLIDDDFMAIWNKVKSECSTTWLSQLQQQLTEVLPPELECTENQAADVRVTQHWLRTMVWQLSITNGYLSSSSEDVAMTFKYPIYIAKDLVHDVLRLSQQSLEVHGIGLIEKLFDVACTLTDVITCVPLENDPALPPNAPTDYLNQLLALITRLRGGSSKYQLLLVHKVAETLPSLTPNANCSPNGTVSNFLPEQNSNSTIPLPILAPAAIREQPLPLPLAQPSPSQSQPLPRSPFNGIASYNDHPRGLIFDAYSPSVSHGSDMAITPLTPPIGASPQSLFSAHSSSQQLQNLGPAQVVPRSVPPPGVFVEGNGIKYEGFGS